MWNSFNTVPFPLTSSSNGSILTQLPAGPSQYGYENYIMVQIKDQWNAMATYQINNPIKVEINSTIALSMMYELLSMSITSPECLKLLNTSDPTTMTSSIISFASILTIPNSANLTKFKVQSLKEKLVEKIAQLNATNIQDVYLISAALSSLSSSSINLNTAVSK